MSKWLIKDGEKYYHESHLAIAIKCSQIRRVKLKAVQDENKRFSEVLQDAYKALLDDSNTCTRDYVAREIIEQSGLLQAIDDD